VRKTGGFVAKRTISIMGKTWLVFYQTSKQFQAVFGKGARAITLCRARQMHFDLGSVFYKDNGVVHELTHAYLHEMGFSDLVYKDETQIEEAFCVLNEMRGADIIKQAKPLTKLLHSLVKVHGKKTKLSEDEDED
jgi:hypothetical protein